MKNLADLADLADMCPTMVVAEEAKNGLSVYFYSRLIFKSAAVGIIWFGSWIAVFDPGVICELLLAEMNERGWVTILNYFFLE